MRLAAETTESTDVVEEVGEGVAEELEEVEEDGGKVVYGEIPGGTPRRNKGSWNISIPPGEAEGAGDVLVVVPVAMTLGFACVGGARVGVARVDVAPTRLVSAASFCCCSMMANICFCMLSSCSVLEGSCL